jgi:hypothetical protein
MRAVLSVWDYNAKILNQPHKEEPVQIVRLCSPNYLSVFIIGFFHKPPKICFSFSLRNSWKTKPFESFHSNSQVFLKICKMKIENSTDSIKLKLL